MRIRLRFALADLYRATVYVLKGDEAESPLLVAVVSAAVTYPGPPVEAQEVAVVGGVVDLHRGGPSRLTVPMNEAGYRPSSFP